jgi:hypothetical protein
VILIGAQEPETIEATYEVSSAILQDGRASYDAAGRMASYTDWGAGGIANANLSWKYDAAGNIRNVNAAYKAINADGSFASYDSTQSYWYKYDALNRMVTTKGVLNGTPGSGTISRGSEGSDIAYDAAGQRATMTTGATPKLETYSYNAMGYLTKVSIQINGGTVRDRATYARDLLGRVTDYVEYDNAGTLVHARGDVEYNKRDQVLLEKTRTKQGSDWIYTHTVNYYTETGAAMAQPANIDNAADIGTSTGTILAFTETKNWKNGSSNPVYGTPGNYSPADLDYADSYVTNLYNWYDSAVQANIVYVNRDGTTNAGYQYDGNGSLIFVDQNGGNRPRDITFVTDAQGRVLERTEASSSTTNPRQRYYRFNGIDMGAIGNNGSDNVDFDASIALRIQAAPTSPGAFRGGATTGTPFADFDMSYDAINGTSEAMVASYYTVRNGDTLATIAQAVWGDASLWYMLAEANGLSGAGGLVAGTGLIIPEKGSNFRNSADTFRPYDPQAAIGDTQPGAPKPPKQSNKCGVFGQILVTLVAVAVTIVATPFVGPVAAAMIGSAVSQAYGMAIGVQSKFSFKAVALAGVTAGVAQGVGSVVKIGTTATSSAFSRVAGDVIRGAVSSAATQGVAVATGLQQKFSWTSVATAGVGAGLGGAASRGLATLKVCGAVQQIGSAMSDVVIQASTRSLIDGSDFGDNLIAALPSAIGNLIGRNVGATISGAINPVTQSGVAAALSMNGTPIATTGGRAADSQEANGATQGLYDGDEIVVTANRPSSYVPINIEFRAPSYDEMSFAEQLRHAAALGFSRTELSEKRSAIKTEINERFKPNVPQAALDVGPNAPPTTPDETLDRRTNALWKSQYIRDYAAKVEEGIYSKEAYLAQLQGYDAQDAYIADLDRQVDAQLWQDAKDLGKIYAITGATMAGGYGVSLAVGATGASGVTAYGAIAFGEGLVSAASGSAFRHTLREEVTLNTVALDFALGSTIGVGSRFFANKVSSYGVGDVTAAERTIAAQNVWEARSILRSAGLNPAQRGEVIRSFDLQSFHVERTLSDTKAYRLFDDTGARLEGRYVSGDFFANQTDRIQNFALMGNSATRLGEVSIPRGSVIFTGRVAPQLRFSSGLTGGANQTFLTGPLSPYTFHEIPMPR